MKSNAHPIREAVVNLHERHTLQDLEKLAKVLKHHFKIDTFQIFIHRDEGRTLDDGSIQINHHAHLVLGWQDQKTGKTLKLGRLDFIKMQSVVADVLGMERGQEGSKAVRLEAQAYKAQQEVMRQEQRIAENEAAAHRRNQEQQEAHSAAEAEAVDKLHEMKQAAETAKREVAKAREELAAAQDAAVVERKKKILSENLCQAVSRSKP